MTTPDLDNWFTYHPPYGTQVQRYQELRAAARACADVIVSRCPDVPERETALTALRFAAMCAAAAIACGEPPAPVVTTARRKGSIGVGGQSNASGRGKLVDLPSPFPRNADNLTAFKNDWTIGPAAEPLDDSTGQIDGISRDVLPVGTGVGPAVAMADRLVDLVPIDLLLVPCAMGGTPLSQWMPAPTLRRDSLFGSMIARLLYAHARAPLVALLWYQGENDARAQADADAYAVNTQRIFDMVRFHLALPHLPIVYAQLHPTNPNPTSYLWWDQVRAAQVTLQRPDTPDAPGAQIMVPALGAQVDTIHLATSAQLDLGRRMAEAVAPFIGAP